MPNELPPSDRSVVAAVRRLRDLFSDRLRDSLAESDRGCVNACEAFESAGLASARISRSLAVAARPGTIAEEAMAMRESLNAATVALQFHDRLTQQVDHVRSGLNDLSRLLEGDVSGGRAEWDARLAAWGRHYEAEHHRLISPARAGGAGDPSLSPGDAADTELF